MFLLSQAPETIGGVFLSFVLDMPAALPHTIVNR